MVYGDRWLALLAPGSFAVVIMERPAPDSRRRKVTLRVGTTRSAELQAKGGRLMGKNIRFVGLDVHAETISAAVAEPDGEVRSLGTIANRPEAIGKLVKKLGVARISALLL